MKNNTAKHILKQMRIVMSRASLVIIFVVASVGSAAAAFFPISEPQPAVLPSHVDAHTFQPVHDSRIIAVNKVVDGALRMYLAYDSDPSGRGIRLYYTNDLDGPWTPYSGNPILGRRESGWIFKTARWFLRLLGWMPESFRSSNHYRWPSTVWDGSTLHMFLADQTDKQIERWISTDGITYTFQEALTIDTGTVWMNPFVWKNPNDNKWYLYHKQHGTTRILLVRSHAKLDDLDLASDTEVLRDTDLTQGSVAAPAVFYHDGSYWLMTEGGVGGVWKIFALKSTSPESEFVMTDESPVLGKDEAVPIPLVIKSRFIHPLCH